MYTIFYKMFFYSFLGDDGSTISTGREPKGWLGQFLYSKLGCFVTVNVWQLTCPSIVVKLSLR